MIERTLSQGKSFASHFDPLRLSQDHYVSAYNKFIGLGERLNDGSGYSKSAMRSTGSSNKKNLVNYTFGGQTPAKDNPLFETMFNSYDTKHPYTKYLKAPSHPKAMSFFE